jgi:uncharacterized protein
MSETLLSPGVLTRENDLSFVTPAPVEAGALFIGPTVKGPVLEPTVVTSYNEYVRRFGDVVEHEGSMVEFFTSIAVRQYFSQGGSTALISRVVSGSFLPATSLGSSVPFTLETLGKGAIYNSSGNEAVDGTLANGTVDNFRWEITGVNTNTGTFTILVRRGDDRTRSKIILESFTVSLDPTSDIYIEKVIGTQTTQEKTDGTDVYIETVGEFPNRSNFIRVTDVEPIINYTPVDSGLLPVAQSGSFENATGGIAAGAGFFSAASGSAPQGIPASAYTNAFAILSNKDEYQFNIVAAPGIPVSSVQNVISLAESRQDCIAVVDTVSYGALIGDVKTAADSLDSSYAATYWPWLQVRSATGKNVWVPASVVIPSIFALTDRVAAPWFAPAGLIRGGLPGVIQTERKLTVANRDALYSSNVNPIATLPGQGVNVLGQKTLQSRASALDRVNVRRLLIEVKKFVSDIANGLLFEQNTIATRNRFLAAVNPYLESVTQRQGLFAYRVVMDDTNNTADVIDRNQLVGQIFIQPTRTAEFIILDFTIEPTGATFGD